MDVAQGLVHDLLALILSLYGALVDLLADRQQLAAEKGIVGLVLIIQLHEVLEDLDNLRILLIN